MYVHWLGYAGTTLVILAYLPQIIHLWKERCSAGLCVQAYLMWGVASLLLLSYAVSLRDAVFIALQGYQFIATGLIFIFCKKYEHSLCEDHGGKPGQQEAATDASMASSRVDLPLDAITTT